MAMSKDISSCHTLKGAAAIELVKARDAAEHPRNGDRGKAFDYRVNLVFKILLSNRSKTSQFLSFGHGLGILAQAGFQKLCYLRVQSMPRARGGPGAPEGTAGECRGQLPAV